MEQSKNRSQIVAENLKRYIKEKFGTQAKFAEALPTAKRNVERWCSKGIKDVDTISEIAVLFGVSFFSLLSE